MCTCTCTHVIRSRHANTTLDKTSVHNNHMYMYGTV